MPSELLPHLLIAMSAHGGVGQWRPRRTPPGASPHRGPRSGFWGRQHPPSPPLRPPRPTGRTPPAAQNGPLAHRDVWRSVSGRRGTAAAVAPPNSFVAGPASKNDASDPSSEARPQHSVRGWRWGCGAWRGDRCNARPRPRCRQFFEFPDRARVKMMATTP